MNYFMIFGTIVSLQSRLQRRIEPPSNLRNKRLALVFSTISQKNVLDNASIKTVEGESLHGIISSARILPEAGGFLEGIVFGAWSFRGPLQELGSGVLRASQIVWGVGPE